MQHSGALAYLLTSHFTGPLERIGTWGPGPHQVLSRYKNKIISTINDWRINLCLKSDLVTIQIRFMHLIFFPVFILVPPSFRHSGGFVEQYGRTPHSVTQRKNKHTSNSMSSGNLTYGKQTLQLLD